MPLKSKRRNPYAHDFLVADVVQTYKRPKFGHKKFLPPMVYAPVVKQRKFRKRKTNRNKRASSRRFARRVTRIALNSDHPKQHCVNYYGGSIRSVQATYQATPYTTAAVDTNSVAVNRIAWSANYLNHPYMMKSAIEQITLNTDNIQYWIGGTEFHTYVNATTLPTYVELFEVTCLQSKAPRSGDIGTGSSTEFDAIANVRTNATADSYNYNSEDETLSVAVNNNFIYQLYMAHTSQVQFANSSNDGPGYTPAAQKTVDPTYTYGVLNHVRKFGADFRRTWSMKKVKATTLAAGQAISHKIKYRFRKQEGDQVDSATSLNACRKGDKLLCLFVKGGVGHSSTANTDSVGYGAFRIDHIIRQNLIVQAATQSDKNLGYGGPVTSTMNTDEIAVAAFEAALNDADVKTMEL